MLNETTTKVIEGIEKGMTLEVSFLLLTASIIGITLLIKYKLKRRNKMDNTKEIKGMSKEAGNLRKAFRKEYEAIAEDFGKLASRMDAFLAEMEVK